MGARSLWMLLKAAIGFFLSGASFVKRFMPDVVEVLIEVELFENVGGSCFFSQIETSHVQCDLMRGVSCLCCLMEIVCVARDQLAGLFREGFLPEEDIR